MTSPSVIWTLIVPASFDMVIDSFVSAGLIAAAEAVAPKLRLRNNITIKRFVVVFHLIAILDLLNVFIIASSGFS
jgi:hypothetical protein